MSKKNFGYWKEVVGLEDYNFPHLIKLDEENIGLARIAQSRINEIRKAIVTNRIVDIQVQPGWGATTLFRYMANDMENNKLNLCVLFDFEKDNFQDGNLSEKKFIFQIKWKLAKGILDIMLDHPLQECYMFEVFEFEDTGEKPWKAYLREKRKELNESMNNSRLFYQNFPFYTDMNITECVDYFLRNFQIQTIFMYLFPRTAEEDDVLEFVGIIKNIFDGKNVSPAAIREVFFITPKLFKMIKQCYERPYMNIIYQQYSAAEIFGMLVNTYRPQDVSNATISDVFEQEFISCVYDKTLTLNEIMQRVEEEIISVLEVEKGEIPFKLMIKNAKERINRI
jgi:hypothetical protein